MDLPRPLPANWEAGRSSGPQGDRLTSILSDHHSAVKDVDRFPSLQKFPSLEPWFGFPNSREDAGIVAGEGNGYPRKNLIAYHLGQRGPGGDLSSSPSKRSLGWKLMLIWIIFLLVVASLVAGRLEVMAAVYLYGDCTFSQKCEGPVIVAKFHDYVSSWNPSSCHFPVLDTPIRDGLNCPFG